MNLKWIEKGRVARSLDREPSARSGDVNVY